MDLVKVSCQVCTENSSELLFEKNSWKIVRCRNCGFIYTNPIPTRKSLNEFYSSGIRISRRDKDPETMAKLLDDATAGPPAKLKPIKKPTARIWVRRARLLRWRRHIPTRGRLLDVGCAQGHLVLAANATGLWDCYGADIQFHKLRQIHMSDPHAKACLAAVDELSFKKDSFDVVTMTHVLEHMFDPLFTLHELSRIMRPNGVLVITVPNIGHPIAKLLGPKWKSVNPPGHLWYFAHQTLERLVEKAGMAVTGKQLSLLSPNMTVFACKRSLSGASECA
jgi:2-polyprenyl-3-methyl-5-hydroxy-6-metoxy-1,4-benzoquinol methylase